MVCSKGQDERVVDKLELSTDRMDYFAWCATVASVDGGEGLIYEHWCRVLCVRRRT